MNANHQKSAVPSSDKATKQQQSLPECESQDDRYPGTFFRVPGVPLPGKTTWSLVK